MRLLPITLSMGLHWYRHYAQKYSNQVACLYMNTFKFDEIAGFINISGNGPKRSRVDEAGRESQEAFQQDKSN
jgi:hypothetical protein